MSRVESKSIRFKFGSFSNLRARAPARAEPHILSFCLAHYSKQWLVEPIRAQTKKENIVPMMGWHVNYK